MKNNINSAKNDRKSNIEILKILCMLGVVILHINHSDIGGALDNAVDKSNFILLNVFQQLSYIAVDLLVIISGFFLANRKNLNFIKPATLLLQVIIFKFVVYLFSCFIGKEVFSFPLLLIKCLPASYYVIFYIALYLIAPLINKSLNGLNDRNLKIVVILLLFLFSVEPWFVDILESVTSNTFSGLSFISTDGSNGGYTIVNFVLCYIVGFWIRNDNYISNIKMHILIILFILVYGFNLICRLWLNFLPVEYCSPFVIAQAALVFCIFQKFAFSSKIINNLATASFTVYLLNTKMIALFQKIITKLVRTNPFLMIFGIIIISLLIYIASYIIQLIYDFVINKLILKKLIKKFDMDKKCKIDLFPQEEQS